ncbi:Uncharacterised protein [Mycobacteroides abscessus subsp. bolletii]|uniref:hypothetical protein n=1 Tax=Mycobacteroides abscessus TaxID=36809 RepID=UPI000928A453|nr:hypothetical protein [Mycobacteroides abscessus]SHY53283.1 Uncharacterised protein [Mycobacteroides abscessus subsp. bolletii]SKQ44919.1 Uncharacterised protein [Mycobacteroides abscessus subsp. bolletii]SKQ48061.1 Uncharacterised protein [Mycobacteroides abscessus subsp. bolletii]SKQ49643.1 Uncharacterised protein [Mycobacteroides abscessus subsp. bolletii]SKY84741.1 Uncharacterised protein [Mycobacteroides abscessus subsp. bolletii]
MFTADHPNARWLASYYTSRGHGDYNLERFSPHFVIHTGGVRLAATGGMDFLKRYIQRRQDLTDANVEVVEFGGALADDHYGINWGTFRTTRGDDVWVRPSLGAWRFENGLAAEHWELANGPRWDEFFLATDPHFSGTPEEFWTQAANT